MPKFKKKQELDLMSEKEIEKYRYKILTKYIKDFHDSDEQRYITELEFYTNDRFDTTTKRFNQWSADVEKGEEDELSLKMKELIVSTGPNGMMWLKQQEKEQYGELKFIL